MRQLTCEKLQDDLYVFEEGADRGSAVNAYLYAGRDGAVVIDTLEQHEGLYDAVRQITDLPMTALFTHVHPDHVGVSTEAFFRAGVELSVAEADLPFLGEMCPWAREEWFHALKDGAVFDLGGRKLEAIFLPGHTPGSCVFLDRDNRLLFSGDAIGSGGFWMQLSAALPLETFYKNALAVYEKVKDIDGLSILVGHRWQKEQPTDLRYYEDVLRATEGILDGTLRGKEESIDFGGKRIKYRTVDCGQVRGYCYDPGKLFEGEAEG